MLQPKLEEKAADRMTRESEEREGREGGEQRLQAAMQGEPDSSGR